MMEQSEASAARGSDEAEPAARPGPAAAVEADPGRAHHYGVFYGLDPVPTDRPLLVVHGNCQAESLRVVLQRGPSAPCASVRIPPVHELAADEVPLLERLLGRARWVLTQPIADDYRGLPLGSHQVALRASRATTMVYPVFRYAGLHPWQIVYHHPGVGDPPLVPYHDARTLLAAAGLPAPMTTADGIRAVSRWSLDELARREATAGAIPVSDLVRAAGTGAAHTVNHPGNEIIVGLARRVEAGFGWPVAAGDPGRTLLDSVHAPVEAPVRAALGLPAAGAGEHATDWVVGGKVLSAGEVRAVQLDWYAQHPAVVTHLVARSAAQLLLLGATGLPG